MKEIRVHGWFKPVRHNRIQEKFEDHDVYIVKKLQLGSRYITTHKDYRVGSKVYKDYTNCPDGHFRIRVIEY